MTAPEVLEAWRFDIENAPEGESVIIATTGDHVGEAIAPVKGDPDDDWFWAGAGFVHANHKVIAWMPMPTHPAARQSRGGEA